MSGHLDLNKTYERLRSTYFWNNMIADLQRCIKSCVSCAQKKRDVYHTKPPLLPIAISGPWEVITADCMGPLPATNLRNRYILINGDLFTKYIETAALPSIETVIMTLVFRHGPPHRFLSDRGTNFKSKLMTQLCNDLNINKVFTSSYHSHCNGVVEGINGVIMQIIAMYVASDHKDWDTYLLSAKYAYNTSLSETTADTPFFLTYSREPVKLLDVALIPPLIQSKSVDYRREQLIQQIGTARQLAAECIQQAQQRMKLYYYQHAKDHPFRVGHKVWVYNPAVKPGLLKKQCSLWHGSIPAVSFKITNLQGKLQKGSIHVSRMKQCFTYGDPPIDPPAQSNSTGNSPDATPKPQNLFTEPASTEDIELADGILANNSRNIARNHVDDLEEINPLPHLTQPQRQQQKLKSIHNIHNQLDTNTLPNRVTIRNIDNQLDINTLPNSVTNHGKRKITHSVEKETPASSHTLPDHVTNCGKQSVARSRETNNFDQQKTRNEDISIDTYHTLAND